MEVNVSVRDIISVVVAIAVSVAFLAVVVAPYFNIVIPQTTAQTIFALFAALVAGAGGVSLVQLGQKQALTAQAMAQLNKSETK